MEAIVLAGGAGSRLKNITKNIPKPMVKIKDKPFLQYLFDRLLCQGVGKISLSVGYHHEVIRDFFRDSYRSIPLAYVVEKKPLGTGGALKKALAAVQSPNVLVVNGDTFFDIDIKILAQFHASKKADVTIALKPMKNFERYGTVKIDTNCRVIGFQEKKIWQDGLINGGIYIFRHDFFDTLNLPEKFSLERQCLERYFETMNFFGRFFDDYFIDIGTPQDYQKARKELR